MNAHTTQGVLVIYTGGTIGSKPSQEGDEDSPQVVVPWAELEAATPELVRMQERFPVDAYEGIPALDSCNVGPVEWKMMAEAIAENYDKYVGFVILHGTDTMVYTATALSYMLRFLGKPVILTGAQRSALVSVRNDATQNLLTALEFANPRAFGLPDIPEVCVYFGGLLLRGNRTVKRDTNGYSAYESPNLAPLGLAGDKTAVDELLLRPGDPNAKFTVRTRLNTNVLPIFISPGIQDTEMVKRQLETPGLKAVVVQAFGSGNIPTKPEFIGLFREAHARGVVLAAVSQCRQGPVELGIYETSAALIEAGFVCASDCTLEAAQVKLMTLFGNEDTTQEEVELQFQRSLAGEQSESLLLSRYANSGGSVASGKRPPGRARVVGASVTVPDERDKVVRAQIRLRAAQLIGPPSEEDDVGNPVDIQIYADLSSDDPLVVGGSAFVGEYRRWPRTAAERAIQGERGVLMIDVTEYVKTRLDARERVSFTIAVATPDATLTWESVELAVYAHD